MPSLGESGPRQVAGLLLGFGLKTISVFCHMAPLDWTSIPRAGKHYFVIDSFVPFGTAIKNQVSVFVFFLKFGHLIWYCLPELWWVLAL